MSNCKHNHNHNHNHSCEHSHSCEHCGGTGCCEKTLATMRQANEMGLKVLEFKEWDDASKMLESMLHNGYLAVVIQSEDGYIINYDWLDPMKASNQLMWVEIDRSADGKSFN